MVLVGVALGLIVDSRQVSTRCGPKFVAVSHLLHARYIRVAVRVIKTMEDCHTCRSITRVPKLNRSVTSALAIWRAKLMGFSNAAIEFGTNW
jgi:hypothetical protein